MTNLLNNIPAVLPDEICETVLTQPGIRIQRILSKGHHSPDQGWYDQQENEWVLLLQGQARLLFEDGEVLEMNSGDWVDIPAHRKHKVLWTTPDNPSIWLAVFYPDRQA